MSNLTGDTAREITYNEFYCTGLKASPIHREISERDLLSLPKRNIRSRQRGITNIRPLRWWNRNEIISGDLRQLLKLKKYTEATINLYAASAN